MATTWQYWTNQDYSTCTSSTSTNATWSGWCTATTWNTTTDATASTTWVYEAPTRTPEEEALYQARQEQMRLENERRQAEYAEQAKLAEEKRKAADEKALQLLLDNLDDNQAEIYKRTGAIPVTGQSGKLYRIRKGTCRNVEEVDCKGCVIRHLCFHPKDSQIPVYDSMLTQKLMLELHEQYARGVANFS